MLSVWPECRGRLASKPRIWKSLYPPHPPLPLPLARLLEHPLPHPRSVPKLSCHLSCGCSPFPARQRGKGFPGASASQSSQELVLGFLSPPPVLCAPLLDPPSPVSPALLLPKLHGLLAGRTPPPPCVGAPSEAGSGERPVPHLPCCHTHHYSPSLLLSGHPAESPLRGPSCPQAAPLPRGAMGR